MKKWKVIVLITLITVTTGCAIDNRSFFTRNVAFSDAQKLITQGKLENGLEKLEQAAREEPENKEIRNSTDTCCAMRCWANYFLKPITFVLLGIWTKPIKDISVF